MTAVPPSDVPEEGTTDTSIGSVAVSYVNAFGRVAVPSSFATTTSTVVPEAPGGRAQESIMSLSTKTLVA